MKGPVPGFFDNHLYRVESISECQSRFIQSETFSGVGTELPDRTTAFFAERVPPGYRAFDTALKTRVEGQTNPKSVKRHMKLIRISALAVEPGPAMGAVA